MLSAAANRRRGRHEPGLLRRYSGRPERGARGRARSDRGPARRAVRARRFTEHLVLGHRPGHRDVHGHLRGRHGSVGPGTSSARTTSVRREGGAATPTTEPGDDFGINLSADQTQRSFFTFNGTGTAGIPSTNSLTIRPYLNATHAVTDSAGNVPAADGLDTFGTNQSGAEINNFGTGSVTAIYTGVTGTCTTNSCPYVNTTASSCQDPATTGYVDATSCANLALSFAMAQTTFPVFQSTTASSNLASQYNSGADGNNTGPATNRSLYPLGGVLDSTPAVVGTPAAQVRDDSYQAFVTALSPATLSTSPRNTTLFVATVDGLLHAFDTTVGLGTVPLSKVESWAFIPPAVLPNLLSNYPGANNILLDGAPVVRDVIFSRTYGQATPWMQEWHTMLVAGFGSGGRGYYAVDVTDPRLPTATAVPATTATFGSAGYPTHVNGSSSTTLTGPHFQWQITSPNMVGNSAYPTGAPSTNLFGKISGTPVITSVYADPTLPSSGPKPQEIGVAILPGGRDGLPVSGLACPRELSSFSANVGNYSTGATLYSTTSGAAQVLPAQSPYNLADTKFPPRNMVRAWAPSCSGSNSAVAGRSVMVVSIATGQILALFARAPTSAFSSSHDPTAWDVPSDGLGNPAISSTYIVPTPLDSPMTGIPIVYPSGVGVVAQEVFIGDADGTMWRFDISNPNPKNWTGAIFADAYSVNADTAATGPDNLGASLTSPDWKALDSEAIVRAARAGARLHRDLDDELRHGRPDHVQRLLLGACRQADARERELERRLQRAAPAHGQLHLLGARGPQPVSARGGQLVRRVDERRACDGTDGRLQQRPVLRDLHAAGGDRRRVLQPGRAEPVRLGLRQSAVVLQHREPRSHRVAGRLRRQRHRRPDLQGRHPGG